MAEATVISWLQVLGLAAEKLPESDEKMPDLLAHDSSRLRYLVEVKEKLANPDEEANRRKALDSGGVYSRSDPLARVNRLSGIVREAVDQLSSPAAPAADLRLLCFVASGRDPRVQMEQLFHTVYGAWTLLDLERGESRNCLYYTYSDFYRFSDTLDGVLGLEPEAATLWINTLSPRAAVLANSELATNMGAGVYDPTAYEEKDLVYLADTDLDRRERGPVLLYVQRKYDRWHKLTEVSPVAHTAEIVSSIAVQDSVEVEVIRKGDGA